MGGRSVASSNILSYNYFPENVADSSLLSIRVIQLVKYTSNQTLHMATKQ